MTTYWQTWARRASPPPGQRDPARARVLDRPRAHLLVRAAKRLARNRERVVGGEDALLPPLPVRAAGGPRRRLLDGGPLADRARALLNDYLTASNANLSTVVDKALDELRGKTVRGNNVVTTLDLDAQSRRARSSSGTNCGAVVALDPRTGRVLVMAASPSFDPNRSRTTSTDLRDHRELHPGVAAPEPRERRPYVPGSTFKVITASAALESKKFAPESTFYDPGYCTVYGSGSTTSTTRRPRASGR